MGSLIDRTLSIQISVQHKILKSRFVTVTITFSFKTFSSNQSHQQARQLSVTELSHLTVVYSRYRMHPPGFRNLGHLLPLSGEGVELKDVIKVV